MEDMVVSSLKEFYSNKKIFITGHSGFKGSWLSLWLQSMGATVKGYSLAPNTKPNHWELLDLDIESVYCDIKDKNSLFKELKSFNPDIIFHLAAQPLVRESYINPIDTYETNLIGTLCLYECCKSLDSINAIVNITSDKCYFNDGSSTSFIESDRMGGYDPYSSSKACSEILTDSYRDSYWNINDYKIKHNILLASARAGNVIGGGDWAKDRLIPDLVKAIDNKNMLRIRNPKSTRPWQHVLEPLYGYLLLAKSLVEGNKEFANGWNFGPNKNANLTVEEIINQIHLIWNDFQFELDEDNDLYESKTLMLNSQRAKNELKWETILDNKETIGFTLDWYQSYLIESKIISLNQIEEYMSLIDSRYEN